MKELIVCYKLPFSLEQFEIGSLYAYAQSIKSYSAASERPLYKTVSAAFHDNTIETTSEIYPLNYPSILTKLLPAGCDLVIEKSVTRWPSVRMNYVFPHRDDVKYCIYGIHTHYQIQDLQIAFPEISARATNKFYDLCAPDYIGPCCYAYRAIQASISMFCGSAIERIVTSFQNALYKNNFKNSITYSQQWTSLDKN